MIRVINLSLELRNLHVIVYAHIHIHVTWGKLTGTPFPLHGIKKNHWKQHTKLPEGTSMLF